MLCALTPQFPGSVSWAKTEKWAGVAILEWLISESEKTGYNLSETDTAVFVMHKPRMRQLLAGMTEGPSRQEPSASQKAFACKPTHCRSLLKDEESRTDL